jgi:hypothetical protein
MYARARVVVLRVVSPCAKAASISGSPVRAKSKEPLVVKYCIQASGSVPFGAPVKKPAW